MIAIDSFRYFTVNVVYGLIVNLLRVCVRL